MRRTQGSIGRIQDALLDDRDAFPTRPIRYNRMP
jgi:hypothetical protein